MDTLKMLKNGSGIHIKKSHKGLFTKYCNGKVTNECIQRGKHSSDPKIRKRATFADNARHFKHNLGGQIVKAQAGTKVLNFINSDLGKGLLTFIGNGIGQISNSVKSANYAKNFDDATNTQVKAMKEKAYGNAYQQGLTAAQYYLQPQDGVNYGDIDRQQFAQKYAESTMNLEDIAKFKMDRLKEKQQQLEAGSSFNFGDLLQQGLGTVGQILGSKQESPDYFSNYFNNKIELPKTNFSLTAPKQELLSPLKDYSKINNLKLDLLKYRK